MHVSGSVYTDSRLIGCRLINLECAGSMQLSSSGQMFSPVFIKRLGKIGIGKSAFITCQESSDNLCVGSITETKSFAYTANEEEASAPLLRQPWRLFPSILNTDQMAGKLTLFKSGNSGSFPPPLLFAPHPNPPSSSSNTTTTHSSFASLSFLLKSGTAAYQRVTGSS